MTDEIRPYNPLDYQNLGQSVADAMLARPVIPLDALEPFSGAGIYAIYYTGDYSLYATLAAQNRDGRFETPIYVGKAVPSGARRGGRRIGLPGQPLFQRLREHTNSITQAANLRIANFHCRYLIVEDIWIPLGESLLIEESQPLWNVVVDGFGNHDPGSGRYRGQRPMWDTLHPGRPWAERLRQNRRTQEEIIALVHSALAGQPIERLPEVKIEEEAASDEES